MRRNVPDRPVLSYSTRKSSDGLPALVVLLNWGLLYAALSVLALLGSRTSLVAYGMAAFTVAWWIAAVGLWRGRGWSRVLVTILALILALFALLLFIRRSAFIAKHGGLEPADGTGSPMAFLLGAAFETLLLAVPSAVLLSLAFAWRSNRQKAD